MVACSCDAVALHAGHCQTCIPRPPAAATLQCDWCGALNSASGAAEPAAHPCAPCLLLDKASCPMLQFATAGRLLLPAVPLQREPWHGTEPPAAPTKHSWPLH